MIKQILLLFILSLSVACFAGEVNGTVKKVENGKTKNLKDATLKFTSKKDATKSYKTVTDMMGSYTILGRMDFLFFSIRKNPFFLK